MDVVTLGAALNGAKKYTDTSVQALMSGVHYRGSVSYYDDLPANPAEGDSYTVKYAGSSGSVEDGTEYTWGYDTDTSDYAWISFSKNAYSKAETDVLLSGKQPTIDSTHKLSSDLVDDSSSTNKFATVAQLSQIETNKNNILSINNVLPNAEYVLKGELIDASVKTIDGYFVNYNNGNLSPNKSWTVTDFIKINPNMPMLISCKKACYGAYYNENKVRVAGIAYESTGARDATSPETAHYIRLSTFTSVLSSLSIKVSEQLKGYHIDVSQIDNMNADFVNTTTYTVGATGCDFTRLRDAFAACTDGTANNRYIVKFKGDGSEYNLANEITAEELADSSFMGIYVPKYTQLVGIGGKSKCIIVLRLENESTKISTLNLYGSSGLEGLTIIGYNTRYTVHDDFSDPDAVRYVKNCKIIAEKAVYESAWGAGSRSGNTWYFENCEFISNQYNAQPFFSHNNKNFTVPTRFYFDNCRFRNTVSGGMNHITFRSLNNNANGIINEVYIYGCEAGKVHLGEESQSLYGSGILFACSGYGNTFSNTDCTYTSSDGVDYSDRFDFI